MSLSLAFNAARSSISATATQIDASTRNIASASDPNASRKIAMTTTLGSGGAYVVQVSRAHDNALYSRMVSATSNTAKAEAKQTGLDQLEQLVGDPTSENTPSATLGAFNNALSDYRNSPEETSLGTALVSAAKNLTTSLNTASDAVKSVRKDADASISDSVATVNNLLKQFAIANSAVIKATSQGTDTTDALDQRDAVLTQLSEEMGISTVTRTGNDMVIYTDSGATLFETTARTVSFQPTNAYGADTVGGSVYVDGVAVSGPDATMTLKSGRIAGLTELRDETALTYQNQIDEIARGLIDTFTETDPTGTAPDMQGLFTASDTADAGVAGRLAVNAAVDATQGGSATLIRDGGINGTDYVRNADGAESYADWLGTLTESLSETRTFSASGQIETNGTLADYASASVSWLSGERQAASTKTTSESALLTYASTALSNATGINLDDEYARQLELEKTYQASSKLIGVINELYAALFQAVG